VDAIVNGGDTLLEREHRRLRCPKAKPVPAGIGVSRTVDGIHLELGMESLRSLELRDPRGRLLASFPALAGAQGSVELKTRLPVGAVLVRMRTDRGETTRALTSP